MTASREEVLVLVCSHLSEELGIDASAIEEGTRFTEDLEADSLDLVELVMELEDRYGIRITDEEAERIKTVGQAIDFVLAHAPANPRS
jgi:acyl carrier protein